MKKLLTIYAIAGFIFTIAAPVLADDVIMPPWVGEDRTVYAAWGDWADFPGPMLPDYWESFPEGLDDPFANDLAQMPVLLSEHADRNNVIELNPAYELEFSMPNFAEGLYKEVWIQVTYYPVHGLSPLFDIETEVPSDMTEPAFEDSVEWEDGWITEAWSFQIWPNPEMEKISLNFTGDYTAYVDQVVIDTLCVPEPATICLLGLGGLLIGRGKKFSRK